MDFSVLKNIISDQYRPNNYCLQFKHQSFQGCDRDLMAKAFDEVTGLIGYKVSWVTHSYGFVDQPWYDTNVYYKHINSDNKNRHDFSLCG